MEAFAESAKADLVEGMKADLTEDTEAAFVETAALEKNMKQRVQSAAKHARFRLSQAETGLFIARNAIETKNRKDQEETGFDSIENNAAIFFFY